jgi:hypothetical protein
MTDSQPNEGIDALEKRLSEVLRQRPYSYERALEEHRRTDRYDELMALNDEELAELYAQAESSISEAVTPPDDLLTPPPALVPRVARPRRNWLPAISAVVAASLVVAVITTTRTSSPDLGNIPFALSTSGYTIPRSQSAQKTQIPQMVPLKVLAPRRASSLSTRPHFWWQGEQRRYRLQIMDITTDTFAAQITISGTDAKLPAQIPSLQEGREYLWSVQPLDEANVVTPGGPVAGAIIVILPKERAVDLERQLDSRTPEDQLRVLATAALWYDTFDLVEAEYSRQPKDATWQQRREQLRTYLKSLSTKTR